MPKISNSEDLYRHLVEDGEDSWLLSLLAFAIAEEQRMDWMKHSREQDGVFPNTEAIKDWYQQQPPSVLSRARGDAENVLQQYVDEVLEEVLTNERREIMESAIVRERPCFAKLGGFGLSLELMWPEGWSAHSSLQHC